MNIEEKVSQLCLITLDEEQPGTPSELGLNMRNFMRTFRPGGIIAFRNSIKDRDQVRSFMRDLQACEAELGGEHPLISCIDQRGGSATIFMPEMGAVECPAPMAQCAMFDEVDTLGEEVGGAMARDIADIGFNLNLCPYADFLERELPDPGEFKNVIMGSYPEYNARLSAALARGIRSEGVGATYCVFPGGYGSIGIDPHRAFGSVDVSLQELEERFLLAPKAAIAEGVDAVMLSHFAYPQMDESGAIGTFSERIIRNVLREQLGYEGLVMTDAIFMEAAVVAAGSREEAAIRSVEAGADLVLCSNATDIVALRDAVVSGRLSELRIDESLERIVAFKKRAAISVARLENPRGFCDADQESMSVWIEKALTWTQAPSEPLSRPQAEASLVVARRDRFFDAFEELGMQPARTALLAPLDLNRSEYGPQEAVRVIAATKEGDTVILESSCWGDVELANLLSQKGRRVFVAHIGAPYQCSRARDCAAFIVTYSRERLAVRSAIRALLGEAHPQGRLPIKLRG